MSDFKFVGTSGFARFQSSSVYYISSWQPTQIKKKPRVNFVCGAEDKIWSPHNVPMVQTRYTSCSLGDSR